MLEGFVLHIKVLVVPFRLSSHLGFAKVLVLMVVSSSVWFSGCNGGKHGLYTALDSAVMSPIMLLTVTQHLFMPVTCLSSVSLPTSSLGELIVDVKQLLKACQCGNLVGAIFFSSKGSTFSRLVL